MDTTSNYTNNSQTGLLNLETTLNPVNNSRTESCEMNTTSNPFNNSQTESCEMDTTPYPVKHSQTESCEMNTTSYPFNNSQTESCEMDTTSNPINNSQTKSCNIDTNPNPVNNIQTKSCNMDTNSNYDNIIQGESCYNTTTSNSVNNSQTESFNFDNMTNPQNNNQTVSCNIATNTTSIGNNQTKSMNITLKPKSTICSCKYNLGLSKISEEPIDKDINEEQKEELEKFEQNNRDCCFENHNDVMKIPIQYDIVAKPALIKSTDELHQHLNSYLEDVLLQDIVNSLRELGLKSLIVKGLFLKEFELDILIFLPKYRLVIIIEAKRGKEKNCLTNLYKASQQVGKRQDTIKSELKSDWIFVKAACLAAPKKNLGKYASEHKPKPCHNCSKFILWNEDINSGIKHYDHIIYF